MKTRKLLAILFLLPFMLCTNGCQQKSTPNKTELSNIDLLSGDITLCGTPEFGDVNFPISGTGKSREAFDLGLALLHSFEYEEAEKAFAKVIDADPNCVMAYWGVAMSNFHSLWMQTGTAYLEKGSKILALAQSLPKTEREQDYLDAIHIFYKDWETIDRNKRKVLFENKMAALYKKYPDDKEAAIFYALALNATADPADKTYINQKKAGMILESIFQDQPNHPGVAHYIIHTYDYPELASLALPTARRYAQIAPASAHAQHMPSHIFTRLGLWEEAASANINSISSAVCYAQRITPEGHWDEELHGMDYLVYAYLQMGDNEKAKEQLTYLNSFKKVFPITFKVAYAAAAIPSRIALENKNWEAAANLQPPTFEMDWKAFPWQKSILHFARALGMVHTGDIAASENELSTLKSHHQALVEKGEAYPAAQVKIQMMAAEAWIRFGQGKKNEAIALMKEAAELEYNTAKHPVTPGEVLPAGELLGDLYMAAGQPAEAMAAYERDLGQHPNRFNGLYGAAVAAKAVGDKEKAKRYFESLLLLANKNGSTRRELAEARAFVGGAV